MSFVLKTDGGHLVCGTPTPGRCDCCTATRDVLPLTVEGPTRTGQLRVCGQCIAAALAVRFAAGEGIAADRSGP